MENLDNFNVVLLGIIFNPKDKTILIGRREDDPHISKLSWCFPGGRLKLGEDVGKAIKNRIKEKTGLNVANLGAVFSKVYPEKKDFLAIYFLCEILDGEEKAMGDLKELKWVKPEELEKNFTTSFHPRLKEYIINLK